MPTSPGCATHIFDPFEYLMLRHRHGKLKTDFKQPLGQDRLPRACHLRVQNIGLKTRDMLQLVPDTQVEAIERCSGHDGTYAVKSEFHETSMKICKPVVEPRRKGRRRSLQQRLPDGRAPDRERPGDGSQPEHPLTLLRMAYGI